MVRDKASHLKYNKGKTEDEILASLYDIDAYYTESHPAPLPESSDEELETIEELEIIEELEAIEEATTRARTRTRTRKSKDKDKDTSQPSSSKYYERVKAFSDLTHGQDYTLPLALHPPTPAHLNIEMDSRAPGYELLVKMGWKPGSALGATTGSRGLIEPLPIVAKNNKSGIGAKSRTRGKDNDE